jgi:hypothetical protein
MLVSASGACWPQLSARSEPGAAAAAAGPSLPAYEDPEVPEGSNRKLIIKFVRIYGCATVSVRENPAKKRTF